MLHGGLFRKTNKKIGRRSKRVKSAGADEDHTDQIEVGSLQASHGRLHGRLLNLLTCLYFVNRCWECE